MPSLVLSRKVGECIRIGDDIIIQINEIARGKVRILINAPLTIPVHREEIYLENQKRRQEENKDLTRES